MVILVLLSKTIAKYHLLIPEMSLSLRAVSNLSTLQATLTYSSSYLRLSYFLLFLELGSSRTPMLLIILTTSCLMAYQLW